MVVVRTGETERQRINSSIITVTFAVCTKRSMIIARACVTYTKIIAHALPGNRIACLAVTARGALRRVSCVVSALDKAAVLIKVVDLARWASAIRGPVWFHATYLKARVGQRAPDIAFITRNTGVGVSRAVGAHAFACVWIEYLVIRAWIRGSLPA